MTNTTTHAVVIAGGCPTGLMLAAELAPIYRGHEATGVAQDDAGVDVELGGGRSVRAQYLVGCDGGRSLIRKQAGIDFAGWDPSTSYLIAEGEMSDEPEWGIRRDDKGVHGLAKLDAGKRVRVVSVERHVRQRDEPTLGSSRCSTRSLLPRRC